MTGELARHLLSACTRLGESVVDLNATDPHLISAALAMGCPIIATFADTHLADTARMTLARAHSGQELSSVELRDGSATEATVARAGFGSAALVVLREPCQAGSPSEGLAEPKPGCAPGDMALAVELLKPGGCLAVVTGLHQNDGQVDDPLPRIIAEAKQRGLRYLQHIVALHVPARGEPVATEPAAPPPDDRGALECWALPPSARVHSDLLLFAKPEETADSQEGEGR
ncbi:hypothetical protein [Herbidospora cretacea]|uniref:hypothetical protein n=1 Tax=Herbidospora cretacea TaxID=28444 RepID=UPI000772EC28|nr:hypothetical protein [Herbidospora cretacea]